MLGPMLIATGCLVASASFCAPTTRAHMFAPVRAASSAGAVRRCVSPRASASDGGAEDNWTREDDQKLFNYIAMRGSTARCGPPEEVLQDLAAAWVLIFNVGRRNEGVYTLQGQATPNVLAFERMDDAARFARQLQDEQFDLPTPIKWRTTQLSTFCAQGDYQVSLVPMGALITPPAKNEFDMEAFGELEAANAADGLDDELTSQRLAFERLFKSDQNPPWMQ
jgi:hypothetical protein